MAGFDTRALLRLGSLFRVRGQQMAPAELELAAPVQPVVDVGRMVELNTFGRGTPELGGLFTISKDNAHAGAGDLAADFGVYSAMRVAFGYDSVESVKQELWAWLLRVSFTQSAAISTSGTLTLQLPVTGNQISAARDFLISAHGATAATINAGGGHTSAMVVTTNQLGNYPVPIPIGATIAYLSTATGAGTMRCTALLWAGPVGVFPPGLA